MWKKPAFSDEVSTLQALRHRIAPQAALLVAGWLVFALCFLEGVLAEVSAMPKGATSEQAAGAGTEDNKIKELEEQKKLLEAELSVLKAQKNLILESFPKGQTAALQGSITADAKDLSIPAQLIGHEALTDAAREIARQMKKRDPNARLIYLSGSDFVDEILGYQTFINRQQLLLEEYTNLLKPPGTREVAPALMSVLPAATTGTLSAVADILAYFRTDVTLNAVVFEPTEQALVGAISQGFSQEGVNVKIHYGKVFLPGMLSGKDSSLLAGVREVEGKVAEARQIIETYEAKREAEKKEDPYAPRIPQLKALNTATEHMLTKLSTAATGSAPLQELVKAELIVNFLNDETARFLFAKVTQQGAANKVTKNLFRGTHLSHGAGVSICFLSFDGKGVVRAGGTVGQLIGFRELKTDKKGSLLKIGYEE